VNYLEEIAFRIRERLDPETLPEGDIDALFRLYAVLALAVGAEVNAANVHDAWVAWMAGQEPSHPSLIPFEALDARTADSDKPFVDAIRSVARTLELRHGAT